MTRVKPVIGKYYRYKDWDGKGVIKILKLHKPEKIQLVGGETIHITECEYIVISGKIMSQTKGEGGTFQLDSDYHRLLRRIPDKLILAEMI